MYEAEDVLKEAINAEEEFHEIAEISSENSKLEAKIRDLERRLQNAKFTIDAQREISKNSVRNADRFKAKHEDLQRKYSLEVTKNQLNERNMKKESEAKQYSSDKKKCEKYQEDLRYAIIDHAASGVSREPLKIGKLRKKIESIEASQNSQKELVNIM